jgi:hypothetical protein
MKKSLIIAVISLAALNFSRAGEAVKVVNEQIKLEESNSWISNFSIAPFGTVSHPDFGRPVWGAGISVGYYANQYVSLHLDNTIYDSPGWFDHSAIDRTSLLIKASLSLDDKERFIIYILGAGDRSWELEDWGFGVGPGAEVRFNRHFSLSLDSRIIAWMNNEKSLDTRAALNLRW